MSEKWADLRFDVQGTRFQRAVWESLDERDKLARAIEVWREAAFRESPNYYSICARAERILKGEEP